MSNDPLLPRVRALLAERIESVAQLELLIFMYNQRARAWSPVDASRELRSNPGWITGQMERLAEGGLLVREGPHFRYFAPPDLDAAVDDLAGAYRAFPVTVVDAIYGSRTRANRDLQRFAEAFRLRREPPPEKEAPPG